MNHYDHEDAFKEANLCAGRFTNLAEELKDIKNPRVFELVIEDLKKKYEIIFSAFIEGVEWGRKNPK